MIKNHVNEREKLNKLIRKMCHETKGEMVWSEDCVTYFIN